MIFSLTVNTQSVQKKNKPTAYKIIKYLLSSKINSYLNKGRQLNLRFCAKGFSHQKKQ